MNYIIRKTTNNIWDEVGISTKDYKLAKTKYVEFASNKKNHVRLERWERDEVFGVWQLKEIMEQC